METVVGGKTDELDAEALRVRIAPYHGVLVDLGTGSGRFVYEAARRHPDLFCIGIDAAPGNVREYSARAHRKPARGGVANAMFARGAVEALPDELDGVATHVTVNLPWGSLLRAVVFADPLVMDNIRRMASPGAAVEVLFTYSSRYEPQMMDELGLPEPTSAYLEESLEPAYAEQGIRVCSIDVLDNEAIRRLPLDWGRRLGHARERQYVHIVARVGGGGDQQAAQGQEAPSIILSLAG
jgi:16S rRNA (adenine(1408)-N(1))-methyltransferase